MKARAQKKEFRSALKERGWTEDGARHMRAPDGLTGRAAKRAHKKVWMELFEPVTFRKTCGCCFGAVWKLRQK